MQREQSASDRDAVHDCVHYLSHLELIHVYSSRPHEVAVVSAQGRGDAATRAAMCSVGVAGGALTLLLDGHPALCQQVAELLDFVLLDELVVLPLLPVDCLDDLPRLALELVQVRPDELLEGEAHHGVLQPGAQQPLHVGAERGGLVLGEADQLVLVPVELPAQRAQQRDGELLQRLELVLQLDEGRVRLRLLRGLASSL